MIIKQNQIIEYTINNKITKIFRVVDVDLSKTDVVVFDVRDKTAYPEFLKYEDICSDIKQKIAKIAEKDVYAAPVFSEDDLEAKNYTSLKKRRDAARKIIEPMVTGENRFKILFEKSRSELVKKARKDHKVSRQAIYKWLRKYWRGGMTFNTLIPDYYKCGGKGKARVFTDKKPGEVGTDGRKRKIQTGVVMNDVWRESIITGGKLFYENILKRTFKEAYSLTLEHFHSKRDQETGILILPKPSKGEVYSFRQFYYHYKIDYKANLERALTKRYGKRTYSVKFAPRTGSFREGIYGPGSLYQIDATPADIGLISSLSISSSELVDIILVDSKDSKKIIGRPTIFTVVDAFSWKIVGVAIRRQKEDWMGYREAIINVVEDKVAFCKEYDIVITSDQWESSPLPDQMLADRGAMEGKIADSLTSGLGVQLSNTAPYRPDWKAYVEKVFDLMNKKVIHRLPGSVPQDPEFGQADYRHQSIFTFREFTKIVLRMVIDFNQNHHMPNYPMHADMIADGVEPYPNEIYEWGCINRSVPSREHSIEEVKIHLLPNDKATVKEAGIKFRGLYYTCDLEVKEGWREKAKNLNEWKIKVAFHPRKVEPIYIRFGDGRPPVECCLIDRKSPFIRCEWDEVKDYLSDKNLKNNLAEERTRQTGSDLWEDINKIKKAAEKRNSSFKKNGVNQSKSAQIRDIGKNMSDEIEYENQVETVKSANISSITPEPEKNGSKHITAKNSLSVQELRRRKGGKD